MSDRNTFMETLREVEQIVRTSPGQLTREEILGYFKDSGLNEEQENMEEQVVDHASAAATIAELEAEIESLLAD